MNEATRRKVDIRSDDNPTFHHKFNFNFSLPYIKNKKVLDIGCWTGQYEKLASLKTKQIIGIDPGVKAIKIAKKMVPKSKFKVSSATKLPFTKKSFDTVTILDVIEHIPVHTELMCLNEIKRVLKPGGHLILSTPSTHPLSILMDPAYFIIGHRHYSLTKLKELLKMANFKIVKVNYTGGVYTLGSAIIATVYKHFLNKKFIIPGWIQAKIDDEYKKKGFAEIHLIAKAGNI